MKGMIKSVYYECHWSVTKSTNSLDFSLSVVQHNCKILNLFQAHKWRHNYWTCTFQMDWGQTNWIDMGEKKALERKKHNWERKKSSLRMHIPFQAQILFLSLLLAMSYIMKYCVIRLKTRNHMKCILKTKCNHGELTTESGQIIIYLQTEQTFLSE